MTLPPPTLNIDHIGITVFSTLLPIVRSKQLTVNLRKEVTEIVFSGPRDGVAPTRFGRFRDDFVIDFKRKIRLRLERIDGL